MGHGRGEERKGSLKTVAKFKSKLERKKVKRKKIRSGSLFQLLRDTYETGRDLDHAGLRDF